LPGAGAGLNAALVLIRAACRGPAVQKHVACLELETFLFFFLLFSLFKLFENLKRRWILEIFLFYRIRIN
jgi:hypothetical protein